MRLLPPATIPGRVLSISVSLPQSVATSASHSDGLVALLGRIFKSYDVPATWGLHDPEAAPALKSALSQPGRHEIALRYDATPSDMDPLSAVRRLQLRARRARQLGLPVSTLLASGKLPAESLDILARTGINLVADEQPRSTAGGEIIQTLRFGLWRLAVSAVVPSRSSWLAAATAPARIRRRIDRAIARDRLYRLAIDGAALATNRSAARSLERVLRHVDRRRHQGMLQVLTLADVARELPLARHSTAARSILKSKAA